MNLNQQEATQLFELKKFPAKSASVNFPLQGQGIEIELENDSKRIKFQADVNRRNEIVNKATYQLRHNKVFSLRRLDLGGSHRNPPAPPPDPIFDPFVDYIFRFEDHVHFYFEGYGSRWALPLTEFPEIGINISDDLFDKMKNFFDYCNIEGLRINKILEL